MKVTLTKLEREILCHRLEGCPDAIIECLEYNSPFSNDELVDAIDKLVKDLPAIDPQNETEKQVLYDSVEGSTYYACAEGGYSNGEVSSQMVSAILRAGRSLAKKVEKATETNGVQFPTY